MRNPKVKFWINKLKSRGIKTYEYNNLPDDLRSLSFHRKAIVDGFVEKIGNTGKNGHTGIWRIK